MYVGRCIIFSKPIFWCWIEKPRDTLMNIKNVNCEIKVNVRWKYFLDMEWIKRSSDWCGFWSILFPRTNCSNMELSIIWNKNMIVMDLNIVKYGWLLLNRGRRNKISKKLTVRAYAYCEIDGYWWWWMWYWWVEKLCDAIQEILIVDWYEGKRRM